MRNRFGSLVVENRPVEFTQARGVSDHLNLNDFPVLDLEPDYHGQLPARSHDDAQG
jgi:hypothetical protein